jgi:hypothetical protein
MIRIQVVSLCTILAACSPVMEANRPDPIDLKQFTPGEKKFDVLAQIGSPVASAPDSGLSCDIYKLYTRGPEAVGKGAIAAGEIVADIFTIGLAEVVFTPVEAATKNSKHTVLFCYDQDSKLVSVKESDAHVDN